MTVQKPTIWIGSSRDDLKAFPDEVRRVMGFAINDAQNGDEHPRAKALKVSAVEACLRSWTMKMATLTGPSIPYASLE